MTDRRPPPLIPRSALRDISALNRAIDRLSGQILQLWERMSQLAAERNLLVETMVEVLEAAAETKAGARAGGEDGEQ